MLEYWYIEHGLLHNKKIIESFDYSIQLHCPGLEHFARRVKNISSNPVLAEFMGGKVANLLLANLNQRQDKTRAYG